MINGKVSFYDLHQSILPFIIQNEQMRGKPTFYVLIPDCVYFQLLGNPGYFWPASVAKMTIDESSFIIISDDGVKFSV